MSTRDNATLRRLAAVLGELARDRERWRAGVPVAGAVVRVSISPAARAAPTGCAGAILAVLRESPTPLTTTQVLAELPRFGAHSDTSVKVTLAALVDIGLIRNVRDASGRGYRLG